ncbi:MAG: hypothetical protein AB7I01_09380 [Gammaproteobacteria bacterium]
MSSIPSVPDTTGIDIAVNAAPDAPHVELQAIIAGALLSAAIAFLLTTFGSGVGLTMVSPYEGEGVSLTMFVTAVGLWMVWVAVSSSMAGAYLAGRLRRRSAHLTDHEVEVRDGFHGLAVWALAMLFGAWLAAGATATMARAGGKLVAEAADSTRELVDTPDARARLEAAGARLVRGTTGSASPADIARVLAQSAAADELRAEDRQFLIDEVAARSGRTPDAAAMLVDQAYAQARDLAGEARRAAERARKTAILVAFITAASMLAAGAGAWWAAVRGGVHRDQRTDFSRLTAWGD